MRWIQRWKATKMNPLGPDFATAPWEEFDLSGTVLRFRRPRHDILAGRKQCARRVDIYNPENFEMHSDSESMGLNMLYTGWSFYDRPFGERDIGYLAVKISLTRKHPHIRKYDSFFKRKGVEKWILDGCEETWGGLNRDLWEDRDNISGGVIPEYDFLRYPKSASELHYSERNGIAWCWYELLRPESPIRRHWLTAISDDHMLGIQFLPDAVMRHYFSPDHDIDSAVVKAMEAFMDNFHIKLSPDAQRCLDAAKAEEKTSA